MTPNIEQASECFMCQQAGRGGCLECRTQWLIADIRHAAYEKLGVEQNQREWEERAEKAEARLAQAEIWIAAAKEEIAVTRRSLDAWMESAAQACRNTNFYRDIVVKIGKMLGEAAYISDDGSRRQEVITLKVPELVKAQSERIATLEKALGEIEAMRIEDVTDGSGPSDCTPREKGYLRYVGRSHIIAKEALERSK